ncbi:MAG: UDP-N-acetylmuramoyl-L-alanine--D-glutamate ligase [Oscillospiraceae bacterium]
MNKALKAYYDSLNGKKVFFLGAGISHRKLIKSFANKGAAVTLCDKKSFGELGALGDELAALGVKFELGDTYLDRLRDADIVFRSPGIDYTMPKIQAAVKAGVNVTSEIETFFELCSSKIIGVTGSDGKTTTTTLIAKMLEAAGYKVHLGGNIGIPLLPIIDEVCPTDIAVVELSSFQLISMRKSPDIAVVTNLAPNHLDHHKDMREYIDAKRNILLYQNKDSVAILNAENDITRAMAADVKGELRLFSGCSAVKNGAYMDTHKNLVMVKNGAESVVLNLNDILLPGEHNKENVTTAAATVMSLVSDDIIKKVALEFAGVEHRIELAREKGGVRWYNDSIGTSPTRTIAGLRSFDKKLILIAGGYDKKISYEPLAPEIIRNVKCLLLCGATGEIIRSEVEKCSGFDNAEIAIEMKADLEECVKRANELAKSGDVVLMSPASASFDFYNNFEERGNHFKKLVKDLR